MRKAKLVLHDLATSDLGQKVSDLGGADFFCDCMLLLICAVQVGSLLEGAAGPSCHLPERLVGCT